MSFESVQHQAAAVRLLRSAVAGDRLPHALLFAGPRGVGKRLTVRELAKLLFCTSPRGRDASDLDPCDVCTHCRRVDRGVHPDLWWFRKEPDRYDFRIRLVARRDDSPPEPVVTEAVVLTPMEANGTVTVLDDAEALNDEAANALLKTLEEPPPHATLVLLCADPSRLPNTVLSRCQWVRFHPLPAEFVARKLAEVAEDAANPDETAYVARFAGGSIERARLLLGSGLWEMKRKLIGNLARLDEAVALGLAAEIDAWAKRWTKARGIKATGPEATAVRREAAGVALAGVAAAFADAAALAADASVDLVNADQRESLDQLAVWPPDALTEAVDRLADAQQQIRRYVHTELAVDNALVQTARLRPKMAARA